jgi:hypothetical protein
MAGRFPLVEVKTMREREREQSVKRYGIPVQAFTGTVWVPQSNN